MEIKHIQGDLLKFPNGIKVIAHQANGEGIMGAGIARQIREQIPELYFADQNYQVPFGKNRLGKLTKAHFERENNHYVGYNLYGQLVTERSKDGIPLDYDALEMSLEKMRDSLDNISYLNKNYKIIGFPYLMGCGLAGGEWKRVDNMIQVAFTGSDFTIYYVEYNL